MEKNYNLSMIRTFLSQTLNTRNQNEQLQSAIQNLNIFVPQIIT